MHEVNLRQIDLNLLVIRRALLEERHVSRAAERLEMSQPAVSRALGRLRQIFDDPLLVKSLQGFSLSPRAESIRPRLHLLLNDLGALIRPPQFDPETAQDQLRIACLDLEGALFVPPVLQKMRHQAPEMKLLVHSQPGDHFRLLRQGEVDFVISGIKPKRGEGQITARPLATCGMVCLMDANNPLAQQPMTLQAYVAASHGVVSITGLGSAIMDTLLEERGLTRKVMLRANSFMTIPEYLQGTDLVFALPELTARRLIAHHPLVIRPLPTDLNLPEVSFYLYWHQRHQKDPMHLWVRNTLMA